MIKTQKKKKTVLQCVTNAHYSDVLDENNVAKTDEEGNKLKVFKPAVYVEKEIQYEVFHVENNGETHEFSDLGSAEQFVKDCK